MTAGAAWLLLAGSASTPALANGTETLGPPVDPFNVPIPIATGSGVVAAGVGLSHGGDGQPGTISIYVPGAVRQALLYWEGANQSTADFTPTMDIMVNLVPVSGEAIGGNTSYSPGFVTVSYRADITSLISSGANSLVIDGLDFNTVNDGAGVLVIFDDGSTSEIEIRDGNDYTFLSDDSGANFKRFTVPQTFSFAPSPVNRTARLSLFFGAVKGKVSLFDQRPNTIEIKVDGVVTKELINVLNSVDGEEWDTVNEPVSIPAGATSLTVQAFSDDRDNTGNLPASMVWVGAGLSLALPPVCEVEIDKTCCIPPPPPPAGKCAGKLQEFTMMWDGDDPIEVSGVGVVNPGDTVTFFGPFSDNDVVVTIVGGGESVFHVSCSDKDMDGDTATNEDQDQVSLLGRDCGKSQGNGKGSSGVNEWLLEGFVDKNNDVLDCTPPDPDPSEETACRSTGGSTGDDCQGKVIKAVFEYTGANCEVPLGNPQGEGGKAKASCSGSTEGATASIEVTGKDADKVLVDGSPGGTTSVAVGGDVTITHTDGQLKASTKLDVIGKYDYDTQALEIHTSCSKDLNVGDVFGSLTLVELTTTEGGTVTDDVTPVEFLDECELPETPPLQCKKGVKVKALTLRYLEGGCTISNSQEGKASCTDTGGDLDGDVSITVTGKDADKVLVNGPPGGTTVAVDGEVTITHTDGTLKASTKFEATAGGNTQEIEIHTSCSKALNLGDYFGAFEVVALDLEDNEPVSLGGTVEYQYTISNPGAVPLTVTSVLDDQLGELLAPDTIDLPPTTGRYTLFETRTLDETTVNVVTVTATTDGLVCEAKDDVTVEFIPPPPPPAGKCDGKLQQFTMIWDGDDPIKVSGVANSAGDDWVYPSDTVTFFGPFSDNDVVVTIVGGGESVFHVSCSDKDMDGDTATNEDEVQVSPLGRDCGKSQGNGKGSSGVNDWLLEGFVDKNNDVLDCTP